MIPTICKVCFLIAVATTGLCTILAFGTETDVPKTAYENNAAEELTINRCNLVYTSLGPIRSHKTFYPGEKFGFYVELGGLSRNTEGETEISADVQVVAPDGKLLGAIKQSSKGKQMKDRPARYTSNIGFALDTKPGNYALLVKFTDVHANASKSVMEVIEVKPIELAIVNPRFFHDKRAEVPAPCGGFAGQPLTIVFSLIGENNSVDKHIFDVVTKVIDEHGQEVFQFSKSRDIESRRQPDAPLSMHLDFKLPYPGNYTVHCTLTERSTGKTATHELPLIVFDPLGEH